MTPKYVPLAIAALIAAAPTLPAAEQHSTLNTILNAGRDYGEHRAREDAREKREERRDREHDRHRHNNRHDRHDRNKPHRHNH